MIHVIYKQAEVILTAPWNLSHVDCEEVAAGGWTNLLEEEVPQLWGVWLPSWNIKHNIMCYCIVIDCITQYFIVLQDITWCCTVLYGVPANCRGVHLVIFYITHLKVPPGPPPARPSPFLDIWYFLRPPLALKIEFPHVGEFWSLRAKFVENSHP